MVGGRGVGVVKRLIVIWFGVYEKFSKIWSEAPMAKDLVGGQRKLGKKYFFLDFGSWLNISESS